MAANEVGTIYLLHFDRPYQHASHYLGWTENLEGRLWHHAHGSGARLTAAAAKAGIKWTVVRQWTGTRSDERMLHNFKHNNKLCPTCQGGKPHAGPHIEQREHPADDIIPF
jgi:predicted GIY-YIG superfamily endonuclease